MNYAKHYELLIQKHGSATKPKEYAERHHIVPKCLGGLDEESNLTYLSAEAHYVAHHMLAKIHGNRCYRAFFMMSNFYGRLTTKLYASARKAISEESKIIGKTNGKVGYQNKTGVHGRSKEQMSIDGRKGGKKGGSSNAVNKTGACGRSAEKMSKDGRLGGAITYLKKVGAFSKPVREWGIDHVAAGRKGGQIAGKMPWWYNPVTGETKRCFVQPEGFISGRKKRSNRGNHNQKC